MSQTPTIPETQNGCYSHQTDLQSALQSEIQDRQKYTETLSQKPKGGWGNEPGSLS